MAKVLRGELWTANLEAVEKASAQPSRARPVFILQTDHLNTAGHPTTIVIPGTNAGEPIPPDEHYPLRVRIGMQGALRFDLDLLVDQVRSIANHRFVDRLAKIPPEQIKRITQALQQLVR